MVDANAQSANLGFEAKLFLAAHKLRGSMDGSEYKHVALGLVFLKYISDAFNTVFEFAASTAPTFTSTDGKTDILVFRYNGAVWQEVGRTLNLSES